MAAVFRHLGIRDNAGIIHARKFRHLPEFFKIRRPDGTGQTQPRPGDGTRADKIRYAALRAHTADVADGVFRIRIRLFRRREMPGVREVIDDHGALRAFLKGIFSVRRAGNDDRVDLLENACFQRAVNARRRFFEKAGNIAFLLNGQGIEFVAVENYGFSVPLEPARKWQKLGIVQVVQLAVERERRFISVSRKG